TEIPGPNPAGWDDVTVKNRIASELDEDPPTVLVRPPFKESPPSPVRRISLPGAWAEPRRLPIATSPAPKARASSLDLDLTEPGHGSRARAMMISAAIGFLFAVAAWLALGCT